MNIKISTKTALPHRLQNESIYRLTKMLIQRFLAVAGLCFFTVSTINADTQDVNNTYLQNRDELIKGYQSQGSPLALAYSDWQAAATMPAKPGIHGNRYLMTYVNQLGHSDYIKYAPLDVDLPVGSIVAKESFKIRGDTFKAGPLFFMEKVGIDQAPDADGWFYSRIKANGQPMKSSQKFCHGCHKAYAEQDFLGYPAPEVRFERVAAAGAASPHNVATDSLTGDIARGESASRACLGCHQLGVDAINSVGPVLNNIVGRQASAYPGFNYSPSLKQAGREGLVWDRDTLFNWLAGPSTFLQHYLNDSDASSQMAIQFADEQLRRDIVVYLESLNTN